MPSLANARQPKTTQCKATQENRRQQHIWMQGKASKHTKCILFMQFLETYFPRYVNKFELLSGYDPWLLQFPLCCLMKRNII